MGLEVIVNHQSCLCDEISKKTLSSGDHIAFTMVNISMFWDGDAPPHPSCLGIEAPMLGTLPELTACTSSSGCLFVSFKISFVINQP